MKRLNFYIGLQYKVYDIKFRKKNGTARIEKALLFLFVTTALKNKTTFYFLMVHYY